MRVFGRQGRGLLLAAMVVVGAVCVSYGDNPAALVGRWVDMNDDTNVELFKDGTGVISNIRLGNREVTRIVSKNLTWKTEGIRFMLSYDNEPTVRDYKLSGYELTLTDDGGKAVVWVRKDKVEEYKNKKALEEKKKEVEEKKNFEKTGYFTDSRDGQKYRVVKIGGKTWMAQNLNYKTGNSWCYGSDNSNCEKYGRLYDWNTAMKACPSGWQLPLDKEWDNLVTASGGDVAGKTLKSASGWDNNGNGFDGNGFSALPGGNRYADGSFLNVGKYGHWWTATEYWSGFAYNRSMYYGKDDVIEYRNVNGYGGSVRCLQDN